MTATFDSRVERIEAGGGLPFDDVQELWDAPDILPLGMLADALRRRLHGSRATYVRVAVVPLEGPFEVPVAAGEVLVTGSPDSLDGAAGAVARARAAAGDRAVTAFSWTDVERLAGAGASTAERVLARLRQEGLDALCELPLDTMTDPDVAVERLRDAGFERLRLTVDRSGSPPDLWRRASALQERFGCIQAIHPLPMHLQTFRPTTGYDDVKSVAAARLAAPNVPVVQVDWQRYGPKLAQVALTFGADDVWGISASDAAPDGRRRAAVEEIRRNIEAAGFEPSERDGRFTARG